MAQIDIQSVGALATKTNAPSTVGLVRDVLSSVMSVSADVLHAAWPNRYPLYEMAIQVVSTGGLAGAKIVEAFEFDVMPESLSVVRSFKTVVEPTFQGSYTLDSPDELPSEFSLEGTFGMKHRLIFNLDARKPTDKFTVLNGYGLVKRLESVIRFSHGSDENSIPYKTFLINQSFNQAIQVEITGCQFNQSVSRNGLWVYNLSFTKVSDSSYEAILGPQSRLKQLGKNLLKKVVNDACEKLVEPALNEVFAIATSII